MLAMDWGAFAAVMPTLFIAVLILFGCMLKSWFGNSGY